MPVSSVWIVTAQCPSVQRSFVLLCCSLSAPASTSFFFDLFFFFCSCCMSAPAVELFSSIAVAAPLLLFCLLVRSAAWLFFLRLATSMSAITLSVRLFSFMLLCIWLVGELFLCLRSCLTVFYVAPLLLLCLWSCLSISLISFVSLIWCSLSFAYVDLFDCFPAPLCLWTC